jgi:DNA-binding transcriptional LysR family regulator
MGSHHGSFARAGEAVGLTQSAVSLQVKALEEEFRVTLFDRSRRVPRFTEAGKILLERSAEVLALYDQIAGALGDENSLTGRLKLGAIQTALSGVLPEALAALYQAHPRIRVHVAAGMSAELAMQIVAGEIDAAVTHRACTTTFVRTCLDPSIHRPILADCAARICRPKHKRAFECLTFYSLRYQSVGRPDDRA